MTKTKIQIYCNYCKEETDISLCYECKEKEKIDKVNETKKEIALLVKEWISKWLKGKPVALRFLPTEICEDVPPIIHDIKKE